MESHSVQVEQPLKFPAGQGSQPRPIALGSEQIVVHQVDHARLLVQLLLVIGAHKLRPHLALRLAHLVGQPQINQR